MNRLTLGLIWAAVIVAMAAGVVSGVVDRKAGELMLLILPIVAVLEIARGDRRACWPFKRRETVRR